MDRITRMRELTLFAPSNNAWLDSNLNNLVRDRSKIREILNMHLVEKRLTMENIITQNTGQVNHQQFHILQLHKLYNYLTLSSFPYKQHTYLVIFA